MLIVAKHIIPEIIKYTKHNFVLLSVFSFSFVIKIIPIAIEASAKNDLNAEKHKISN